MDSRAVGTPRAAARRRRRAPVAPTQRAPWAAAPGQTGKGIDRLLWLEPLWIAVLAPLLLLPGRWLPLFLYPLLVLALFAFWPLRWMARAPLLTGTIIDGYLAIFLLWLPLPLWLSSDKTESWPALGFILLGVTAAIALIHWRPCQKRPELIVLGLAGAAAALMVASPALLPSTPEKLFVAPELQSEAAAQIGALTRDCDPIPGSSAGLRDGEIACSGAELGFGETINPNVLAGALILPIPLLMALALQRRVEAPTWRRLLAAGFAVALLAAAILTQSRGAYLGIAAGLWLVLFLQRPRWRAALLLGTMAAVGLLAWLGPGQLLDQAAYAGSVNSWQGRVEVWSHAWAAARDFPLTGIGPGLFGALIPQLYPYASWGAAAQIPHAHNLPLQVLLDLGVPGLFAYGGVIIVTILLLIQVLGRRSTGTSRALAIGALGAQTAVLIHGLVDAVLWSTKLAWMPWLLTALAVLLSLHPIQPRRRRRSHV